MPSRPPVIKLLLSLLVVYCGVSGGNADTEKNIDPSELQRLEREAGRGDDKAQMKLAVMLLQGRGVARDVPRAVSLYRDAAETGHTWAQYRLARLYLDGNHLERDPASALDWLTRAARRGFIAAQLELAELYRNGNGVDVDYVSAYKWLRIAASLEQPGIETRLAELEQEMSFLQLLEARYLARRCMLKGYRDC